MPLPTDEISEKYLQKAITEINELGHELAVAGGGTRAPVLGSGHPLADVMLLKYEPQAAELQEGVAFFGRAGQAILKSLQRLNVDPMAVYGTNCLKFADGDEAEARAWLARELHIVQPKLVVVMGDDARDFVNSLQFPLAEELGKTMGAGSDAHVLQGVGTGALRMRRFEGPEEFLLSLRTAQVLRRPKSLVYLQSLKWVAQAKERVR